MDPISYTTVEQQLNKLTSQKLIIENISFARDALNTYGYSNLIKSYRDPYVITSDNKKVYRSDVTFDQIYSLYILDKNLRNAVMATMLDLEEYVKENAASVLAASFGTHQNDYLNYKNYRNKKKTKKRFSLSGILKTMNETLATDKNPIHHYNTVHGIVPPWILFKSVYFSTIVNFIDLFKVHEQEELVKKLYDVNAMKLSMESLRKLMMDTLFICLEYRNLAAHGSRIYNHVCSKRLRVEEIFGSSFQAHLEGFSQLLFLLNLFKYADPYNFLKNALDQEVDRHCSAYPQDITYLGQILNMNIVARNLVYFSDSSNKFHTNPHCSGIKNVHECERKDAEAAGYIPCKKCCHES